MARETGELGCGLGCDQERTRVQRGEPRRGQLERKAKDPRKQGQARKTDRFTQVGQVPRDYLPPYLSPPHQKLARSLGASEEEAGSNQASGETVMPAMDRN